MIKSLLEKPQVDLKLSAPADDENSRIESQPSTFDTQTPQTQIAKVIVHQQQKQRLKTMLRTESTQASFEPSPPTEPGPGQKSIKKRSYSLDQVPIDSILAQEILGSNGAKLLGARMRLTKGMLDRLKDLRTLGEPINTVCIIIKN